MSTILGPLTLGNTGGGADSSSIRQALTGFTGGSLGQIRITISPNGGFPMWFDNVSMAIVGGATAPNTAATPTPVTFTGNSGPIVCPGGSSIVSDWINFSMASSDTLIVVMDYSATSPSSGATNFGTVTGDTNYSKGSTASYNLATVSGFTSTANSVNNVTLVETQASLVFIPNNLVDAPLRMPVQPAERSFLYAALAASAPVSGMAWFRNLEQFTARQRIEPPPEAYIAPLKVTVGVSGIAWSRQSEGLLNPPKSQPSELGWKIFPTISAGVGVSGLAWNTYSEQVLKPPRADSVAPGFTPPLALVVYMASTSEDYPLTSPRRAWREESGTAWAAQPIASSGVGVSGMAWQRAFEQFTARQRIEQPTEAYVPPLTVTVGVGGMAWFTETEHVYSRKASDLPSSWAARAFVPISGMAWSRQSEQFVSPAKAQPSDLAWAIPPTAVPVGISGMAWWRPVEGVLSRSRIELSTFAYIAPQAVTVAVSGIAWAVSFENPLSRAGRQAEASPFVHAPVPISTGWASQSEQRRPASLVQPADSALVYVSPGAPSTAWHRPFDQITVRARFDHIPASFGQPPFVPVGVSGMAWYGQVENPQRRAMPVDGQPWPPLRLGLSFAGHPQLIGYSFAPTLIGNSFDPSLKGEIDQ